MDLSLEFTAQQCNVVLSVLMRSGADLGQRPRTDSGATAPIFPIVIKCASETDALKVAGLQHLLDGIQQKTTTRNQVAALFFRTPSDDCLDITGDSYYAVWVGHGVGVYHDW